MECKKAEVILILLIVFDIAKEAEIPITGISYDVFFRILEFLYTGDASTHRPFVKEWEDKNQFEVFTLQCLFLFNYNSLNWNCLEQHINYCYQI